MTWLSFKEGRHDIGKITTFDVNRIAFRLAHINRFNGDVGAYSVAQHSVLVASILRPEHKLAGLLHDVHEAFIGDNVTPFKLVFPDITTLENKYLDQIDDMFNVETRAQAVYDADQIMLATEAQHFGVNLEGVPVPEPLESLVINEWHPHHAVFAFVELFDQLTKGAR